MCESAEMIECAHRSDLRSAGDRLRTAHQPAGQRARRLTVDVGLLAGDERVAVPARPLEQPLAAGGKVEDEVRGAETESLEVDHVDVGPVAGREHAPVEQPDRRRGVARSGA